MQVQLMMFEPLNAALLLEVRDIAPPRAASAELSVVQKEMVELVSVVLLLEVRNPLCQSPT